MQTTTSGGSLVLQHPSDQNRFSTQAGWQGVTIEQFIRTVVAYNRWSNEERIKVSLGSFSPVQYRASVGLLA